VEHYWRWVLLKLLGKWQRVHITVAYTPHCELLCAALQQEPLLHLLLQMLCKLLLQFSAMLR
jgi:hypothetical protein